jgi:octaprenyl-diphosphate synthase
MGKTNKMSRLSEIKKPVKEELERFNDQFAKSMKSKIPLLNIITKYILRRKGKQIRPLLVFLSAKAFGKVNSSTYTAATLIELLHTATLVHDDVVDDSYERRGILSINALWKSKIAVLLGDYLLAKGLLISVENKEYELLEIVSEAVKDMSEGELMQIQKSRKLNISEDEYFEIIRKKTASLLAACTICGVYSVIKNDEKQRLMKNFGFKIGLAFQIKDDLFDYEKTTITGKPKGNDIQEKKLTLPLIISLARAQASERRKILKLIHKKSYNSLAFKEIRDFVHKNGGVDYARKKMMVNKDEALALLENLPSNEALESLKMLVNFIIERET